MEQTYSLDIIFFLYPLYFMEYCKVISKYDIYETMLCFLENRCILWQWYTGYVQG